MRRSTKTHAIFGMVASLIPQVSAFWRLPCSSPVVVQRADPIVEPGMVAAHMHTVMGSNAFNFSMTYADTQRASCSTCKVTKDQSSYWVPTLYYRAENGSFTPVKQSGGALIYYLQRTDEKDPEYGDGLVAFPPDFRMIAGDVMNRNYSDTLEQRAVSFACLGVDGAATPELPTLNCPNGLRTQLIFPSCWNGKEVDTADHKSHMAYPTGVDTGFCPPEFPKRFITIFYEVTWAVDEFKDMWYGDRQPFVFSNGDPDGYGYHGDFLNGWDVEVLQRGIDECTGASGVVEECAAFDFRTDEDMAACKVLPRVRDQITGLMAALPGCNPLQAGPDRALRAAQLEDGRTCVASVNEIGDPVMPYTDLSRHGWRFIGCVKDPAGQSRTLDGETSADEPGMTAEACVDLCGAAGFTHAGVEFSTQCFCGDAVADDRMPTNGTMGNCDMSCGGDPAQFCGGAAQVGVYEKCGAGTCRNADLAAF